jgi:hypothetical protein
MFQKTSASPCETPTHDTARAPTLWGFRRRKPHEPAVTAVEDAAFTPDVTGHGFETFGRGGLQLGGLHRDQQWVGAWGGRC